MRQRVMLDCRKAVKDVPVWAGVEELLVAMIEALLSGE